MQPEGGDFERIRAVLAEVEPEGPLTAKEICAILADHGEEIESAHRVATVLGRRAQRGDIEVIEGQPYRYRLSDLA
ncbi:MULTISPECIES: hypothetical protein [unclassified Haladaptatus]|uniref:hypothetical protein n=1 Tax=unclassified Haladaptatus TaxID=2622732 RepID=UPI0023E81101|nr:MULTISPECIES: hypothetical protein [unclassified Haladaptatus]